VRIALIGPDKPDDFAYLIGRAANELGHSVDLLGPATWSPFPASRRVNAVAEVMTRDPRLGVKLARKAIKSAFSQPFDLIISVQSLRPEIVDELSRRVGPVVLWFPDHVSNLGPLWMFSAAYRAVFFKDPLLVQRLNNLGVNNIHYLAEACDPIVHRPTDGQQLSSVAIVGNIYPTRAQLLERLIRDSIPLKLYGGSYLGYLSPELRERHTGLYLRGLEKSSVFCNSIAVLNNLHPAEMTSMNARLFESTAAGALVVTEKRETLSDYFAIDTEVLAFTNYDELMDRLRNAMSDPSVRKKLGPAASRRAHSDHTYAHRLASMFEVLELE